MAANILRILILSFYYPPDLSAGSFRVGPLVDALRAAAPAGTEIEVVTTRPNRYHSFDASSPASESAGNISVYRMAVSDHQSGFLDQPKSFLMFAWGAWRHTKKRDYDIVFATSSRLMTAALGALIAARRKARLFLDIRDIFVDTIGEVLPGRWAGLVKPLFARIEKETVNRADAVNLVSPGFESYFRSRYPAQHLSFVTNGIDGVFINDNQDGSNHKERANRVTVVYAGNLGEGQGMHLILPGLAEQLSHLADFQIIGDGGRKALLDQRLKERGVSNVTLLPPMRRQQLIEEYRQADVLFLHLNAYEAFKKVLPSKIFEYAALGKPILAGVDGFAAHFIGTEISNAAIFHPGDVAEAVRAFASLEVRDTARPEFIAKFSRATVSHELAERILSLASS